MSSLAIPPLPEGWSGTPDELLEWINNEHTINVDGELTTLSIPGRIGGTRPTENIGIWFSSTGIEMFTDGKYRPITDVPIGSGFPWFGSLGSEPTNFLFCDGRSLLRADYAELFAVIGVVWGNDSSTTFNLPDPAGRVPMGAGIGDYADNQADSIVGKMKEQSAGDYVGRNWLRKEPTWTNGPTASIQSVSGSTLVTPSGQQYAAVNQPAFVVNWVIRYR